MKKERKFWGLFFVIGAIFIIVSKLGSFSNINVLSLVITVFLAAAFVKSILKVNFAGVFFSAAFLCIIYAEPLRITAITPWPVLGAAMLASIGCSMLLGKKKNYSHYYEERYSNVVDHEDSNRMTFNTSFGSSIKYVNSDNFEQADITCSFGDMKVYFDNAIIQGGNAIVKLDISFAGAELYIPKSWNVVNKVDVTLGGVDEKNRNEGGSNVTLTLIGDVKFAGVTILYI